MKRAGLLKKHICEKKIQISLMRRQKLSIFRFSHYKSMVTISCHSNQFLSERNKNKIYVEANVLSMYAKYQLHPSMVSEKKIF